MGKSIDKPRRAVLARGLFAASLAAVAAAAVSPDWAATLKAQGYYGSVDLGVTLMPSQIPRAGETVEFLVNVFNAGPDAANRVRTIAGANNLHMLETNGCASGPLGYPHCALPSPLAAGDYEYYFLRMRVPTTARGNMQLSVSVTSDEDEIAPGNEVVLFKEPIAAVSDLQMSLQCDTDAFVGPTGHVACDFEVRNDGPSAALSPRIDLYSWRAGETWWTCQSARPGQCASGTITGSMYSHIPPVVEPGDVIRMRAEMLAPTVVYYPTVALSGSIGPSEADPDYTNNYVDAAFELVLFRDNFEPTSTPPKP